MNVYYPLTEEALDCLRALNGVLDERYEAEAAAVIRPILLRALTEKRIEQDCADELLRLLDASLPPETEEPLSLPAEDDKVWPAGPEDQNRELRRKLRLLHQLLARQAHLLAVERQHGQTKGRGNGPGL